MKTVEEWLSPVGEAVGQDMFCGDPHKPGSRSEDIIKAIQLDAWRQGMTDAAAICKHRNRHNMSKAITEVAATTQTALAINERLNAMSKETFVPRRRA